MLCVSSGKSFFHPIHSGCCGPLICVHLGMVASQLQSIYKQPFTFTAKDNFESSHRLRSMFFWNVAVSQKHVLKTLATVLCQQNLCVTAYQHCLQLCKTCLALCDTISAPLKDSTCLLFVI